MAPLERIWGRAARIEPAVAEIPSGAMELAERGEWLKRIMAAHWHEVELGLRTWRHSVISALVALLEMARLGQVRLTQAVPLTSFDISRDASGEAA